jgi:hypothetical protein
MVLCSEKHLENLERIVFANKEYNSKIETFHLEKNFVEMLPVNVTFWNQFPKLKDVFLEGNPLCGHVQIKRIEFHMTSCETTSTFITTTTEISSTTTEHFFTSTSIFPLIEVTKPINGEYQL